MGYLFWYLVTSFVFMVLMLLLVSFASKKKRDVWWPSELPVKRVVWLTLPVMNFIFVAVAVYIVVMEIKHKLYQGRIYRG